MTIQVLIDILLRINTLNMTLLDLCEQMKQAALVNDIQEMSKVQHHMSKIIKQIDGEEALRNDTAQQLLREKGIKSHLNLNITELSRLVFNLDDRQALLDAQRELTKTLLAVQEVNRMNHQLVEQSLEFIGCSLDFMIGGDLDEPTYCHPALQSSKGKNRSMFVSRV